MSLYKLSIIIPVYNDKVLLKKALDSLVGQLDNDIELIVIDDCSSDGSFELAKEYKQAKVYRNEKNSGPALTRNRAIRKAQADLVAFMDSDCHASDTWVKNILKNFEDSELNCIMGGVDIDKSTFFGDSISALGYPAGGSVGFDKMWRVDEQGYTRNITSCNFAARKEVFEKYGYFDETFPLPGGEDTELAARWSNQGVKIKYAPDIKVNHVARKDIKSFVRWMISRGRSSYQFQQKVDGVGGYIGTRLWSIKNIIKKFIFDPKIILIIPLIIISIFLQQFGYVLEARKV